VYLEEAVAYYTGRNDLTINVDYGFQEDCDQGFYLKFWNVPDINPPTLDQLLAISNQIAPMYEFIDIKQKVIDAQVKKQSEIVLWLDKYNLDCTDSTKTLLEDARVVLKGTGNTSIKVIDYHATPSELTLDDLDQLLGNDEKGIIGVFAQRRYDLHIQSMDILEKVLLGQPYTINYI
jgi:hypothetical protein